MRGHVLDFSAKRSSGVISGSDGQRYTFTVDDWNADSDPSPGVHVDFEADGQEAKSIYVLQESASATPGAAAGPSFADRVLPVLKFQRGAFSELASDKDIAKLALPVFAGALFIGLVRTMPLEIWALRPLLALVVAVVGMFSLLNFAALMTYFARQMVGRKSDLPEYVPTVCSLLFAWMPIALGVIFPIRGFALGLLFAMVLQVFAVKDTYKVPTTKAIVIWAIAVVPAALLLVVIGVIGMLGAVVAVVLPVLQKLYELMETAGELGDLLGGLGNLLPFG